MLPVSFRTATASVYACLEYAVQSIGAESAASGGRERWRVKFARLIPIEDWDCMNSPSQNEGKGFVQLSTRFCEGAERGHSEEPRSPRQEYNKKGPAACDDFCLGGTGTESLLTYEDKWGRAMYQKWGPKGSDEFVSVCKHIQTYQYPLQAS